MKCRAEIITTRMPSLSIDLSPPPPPYMTAASDAVSDADDDDDDDDAATGIHTGRCSRLLILPHMAFVINYHKQEY